MPNEPDKADTPEEADTPDKADMRAHLRPTKALVHDAVDATTWLIGEGHDSTARIVVGALATVPGLEEPAKAVDAVRGLITHGVLGSVRTVNRVVELVSDAALDIATQPAPAVPAVPLHADTLSTPEGAIDQVVGALNGAVGDHLQGTRNGLALGMRLRHGNGWVDTVDPPDDVSGRLVVLVHGLATTELCWSLDAERSLGAGERHYGGMLHESLGLSPIYARYNTGLAIADNGDRLADALELLVARWPVRVHEIALIGHSMGGLVIRAATHSATRRELDWVPRLSHVLCLGSPQQGAPLARLGHHATRALRAVDLPATRIIGRILATRSVGVKDLRHRDLEALGPLLDDVHYSFVAGVMAGSTEAPLARWMGDFIVPADSAEGGHEHVSVHHVKVPHYRLQAHLDVYRVLEDALRSRALRPPGPLTLDAESS